MFSATVTDFNRVFIKKFLLSLCERGKYLSIRRKNVFATFVETASNGGLNQMIFLFLPFKFLLGGFGGIYINGSVYDHFFSEHLRIQVWNC